MAEHPVVACYAGPDSAGALQLGAALAAALRQPLVLAVAYAYEPVALSAVPIPPADDERRAQAAEDLVRRAHRLLGEGAEVREAVVPAEDIAVGLAGLAEDVDASVIVLGRDAEGHVTRDALHHARCPVAVSPFDVIVPGLQPLAAVAVADDGSPQAVLARAAGERIAAVAGKPVDTLTAADDRDAGAELTAASKAYDLLVCGSRGRGPLAAAVLGSVSSRLVRAAGCPVLVVGPRSEPDAAGPLGLTTAAAS